MKKLVPILSLAAVMFIGGSSHALAATCSGNVATSPTDAIAIGYPDGSNNGGTKIAIPITLSSTCTLSSLSLYGYERGSPPGPLKADIQGDSGGAPDGTAITTVTMPFALGSPASYSTSITGSLTAGSYWIVVYEDYPASTAGLNGNDYVLSSNGGTGPELDNESGTWQAQGRGYIYSLDGSSGGGGGPPPTSGTVQPSGVVWAMSALSILTLVDFVYFLIFFMIVYVIAWGILQVFRPIFRIITYGD